MKTSDMEARSLQRTVLLVTTRATMRMVGQMLSMGIATLVFSLIIGKVRVAPASCPLFLQSMRVSFIVFAALCGGGVFLSLARGRVR
jgi:hypothetical protein